MAGDTARVRALIDATQSALDDMSTGFAEEFEDTTDPPDPPDPPEPGTIIRVAVGDNVQAALDQARHEGATLLLAVGEHRVNLKVKPLDECKPVVITSDTEDLPAPGVRITREYREGLARLVSANDIDPQLRYECRSENVHLTGIGFEPLQHDRTMIVFGTDNMYTPDEQPTGVVHDRILMVGDPERGQHRGIMAHVRGYALLNSSLLDFHEEGRDSQALCAWNGGQYMVIKNCTLEAGAENVMFGGGSARAEVMAPQHVLIQDCLFTKNYDWQSLEHNPTVKCLFEIKHLRHAVIRRNVFEHCWPEAWDGTAIAIKSCDQTDHNEPWTLTEQIRFEHNRIRRVGMFMSIVGAKDSGKVTQLMRGLTVRQNLVTEMDVSPWSGRGSAFKVSNMPTDLVIDHNTILLNNYAVMELSFNQDEQGTGMQLTNTALWQGAYGIKGPAGMDAWDWEADLGYAPNVASTARRKHPERTPNWGPTNEVIPTADFDASFTADGAVVPGSAVGAVLTTDGQPIGCDLSLLPALP